MYAGTEVLEIRLHYLYYTTLVYLGLPVSLATGPSKWHTQESISNGKIRPGALLDFCGAAPDTVRQMTGTAVDISGAAVNLDYTYKPQTKPGGILDLPQTYQNAQMRRWMLAPEWGRVGGGRGLEAPAYHSYHSNQIE